jgi:queuine tRNA-ribosyltransferase
LLSLHNLRCLHRITEQAREAIQNQNYSAWALEFGKRYFKNEIPDWFSSAIERGLV